ncbi:MAG: hypothetical protein N2423_06370 [Novosphingobium sp.]|nr:hypothetical protein [Novosphingobium sp.]
MAAGALLAGAVTLLALPSAVLAFTARFEPDRPLPKASQTVSPIKGQVPSVALSQMHPVQSLAKGRPFPFTPAGSPARPDRSVTVAVRLDSGDVRSISVKGMRQAPRADVEIAPLRIAQTAFNLGISRGYKSFSVDLASSAEDRSGRLPDYGHFSLSPSRKPDVARFSPRIVIDDRQKAGLAPRTFAGDRADRVDVGGSYRLTDRLDVTAGVRYSEDRDRLLPLTDGKQDSQAVYVGTQFRF